jgi:hypothetical protein
MRRSSLAAIHLILSFAAVASPSRAAVHAVFPTGVFPDDVANVQAALDQGGLVLLKSRNTMGVPTAFDFGPADPDLGGTATITRDVVILGEKGRSSRTTIRGGSIPFTSSAKVNSSLVNVRFDAPLAAALEFTASSGALIVGNEVSGVIGAPFFGLTEGVGMRFVSSGDPGDFSGHIVVSGNVIRDLGATFSDGLVFDSVAAAVTIAFNRIERVESNGIFMFAPAGDVAILNNVITPGPASGNPFSGGNGIQLIESAGGAYRVEHNKITCENPNADGLLIAGGPGPAILGAVIRRNEISMNSSCCGAISLFDDVSFSTISHNWLRGSAEWGFGLVPSGFVQEPEATGNTFVGNDISQLSAGIAHVLFFSHAHDNVFRGPSGTALDLGENNLFID